MIRLSVAFLSIGLFVSTLYGQPIQSRQNGNWNSPSTWINGIVPEIQSTTVLIHHHVTIPPGINVTVDGVTVTRNGMLTVDAGGILMLPDIPDAMIVEGILKANEGSQIITTSPGSLSFQDNAVYVHNFTVTEGTIPIATWSPESTLHIQGYVSPTNFQSSTWSQSFGNVTWNCPDQTGIINLKGLLAGEIQGSLRIEDTGSSVLRLSSGETFQLQVGHHLMIQNSARLQCTLSGSAELYIGGDLYFESVAANGSRTNTTGSCLIDVQGDIKMNAPGGMLSVGEGMGSGLGLLRLHGDFSLLNGSIREEGSDNTRGRIEFVGTGDVTFINMGIMSGALEYYIGPDTELHLSTWQLTGHTGSSLEVDGTIYAGSVDPQGVISEGTGNGTGNIRVASRLWNPGSQVVYSGQVAQIIGNGHPAQDGVDVVVQNPHGLSFTEASGINTLRIGGNLILEEGDLHIDSNPSARTLMLSGALIPNNNHITFNGDQCDLIINGTGTIGDFPLSGELSLRNLTLNRADAQLGINTDTRFSGAVAVEAGTLVMNGNTEIQQLNITGGLADFNYPTHLIGDGLITDGILAFDDIELTVERQLNAEGGQLQANLNSQLIILGNGPVGNIEFTPGSALKALYLERLQGDVLGTIHGSLYILETVQLKNGLLQNDGICELAEGATITTSNIAGITGNPLRGGPYHIIYTGTANISPTGAELPEAIPVASINVNSTASVLLGRDVEVDSIRIASGTINFNGSSVKCNRIINDGTVVSGSGILQVDGDVENRGTFHAPTSAGLFKLAGNFHNSGTFNQVGGTIELIGATEFTGHAPDFRNIIVTSEFFAPPEFTVRGNFTNNGTFYAQQSTVTFAGTTLTSQEISGDSNTTFHNVRITNVVAVPGVTIESPVQISGILTLDDQVTLDADGVGNNVILTLLSTADDPVQDAGIDYLPSGSVLEGDITIQRYMSCEGVKDGRIYRYLSSPVSNATIEDLQNEVPVTGNFTGSSTCQGCTAQASMFLYDELVSFDLDGNGKTDLNDGYRPFPGIDNQELMEPARGYAVFVRGDILGTCLWDVRGSVNRGEIEFPVTYTSTGYAENDGWNLVGNPFPAAIDFNSTGWTKVNMEGAVYFPDNGADPPRFAAWNGEVGINGGSGVIPIGQGFWVKANGTDPVLKADEQVKVTDISTTFFKTEAIPQLLRIRLVADDGADETIIYFREEASDEFDSSYDARKLKNAAVNLASVSADDLLLAINARAPLQCDAFTPLSISEIREGTYSLKVEGLQNFDDAISIFLVDNFTGEEIDLRRQQTIHFEVNENPESTAFNRFGIQFQTHQEIPVITGFDEPVCDQDGIQIHVSGRKDFRYDVFLDSLQLGYNAEASEERDIVLDHVWKTGNDTLTVIVSAPYCDAFLSVPLAFTVVDRPVIDSVSNKSICTPGVIILNAFSSEAEYINWYDCSRCDVPVASGNDPVAVVLEESQEYFAEPVSNLGCVGERMLVEAAIVPLVPAEISIQGERLISNYKQGNHWIFNGETIDTTQWIYPEFSGVYALHVEKDGCYRDDSVFFSKRNRMMVFPNPVDDLLTIVETNNDKDTFDVILQDMTGKVVKHVRGSGMLILDLEEFSAGSYYLYIAVSGQVEVRIIQRK